jgi:hypothetical protein
LSEIGFTQPSSANELCRTYSDSKTNEQRRKYPHETSSLAVYIEENSLLSFACLALRGSHDFGLVLTGGGDFLIISREKLVVRTFGKGAVATSVKFFSSRKVLYARYTRGSMVGQRLGGWAAVGRWGTKEYQVGTRETKDARIL